MDYASAKFDVRIVAGATMPVNRWALLEEYFRWFQSGLIDDVAMVAETDIRNKKQLLQRKSLYSQLQSQLQSMEEGMKDKDGTIETLERQLVQAGIKNKVMQGAVEVNKRTEDSKSSVYKEELESKAQQKMLQKKIQDTSKMLDDLEKVQRNNLESE